MKTLLPSGVWMWPLLAFRLKVRVVPARVPGVQTMPILGAPVGSAPAWVGASSAKEPAASTTATPSRRILCVIVAVPPRLLVAARLDIGLAHYGLGRKRRARVHPHLGHHSAGPGR